MSDHDLMVDEMVSRAATSRESLYTHGWRTYRDGGRLSLRPDPIIAAGFNDAKYRVEVLRDRIDWSAERHGDDWETDEQVGWQRAETDRDAV